MLHLSGLSLLGQPAWQVAAMCTLWYCNFYEIFRWELQSSGLLCPVPVPAGGWAPQPAVPVRTAGWNRCSCAKWIPGKTPTPTSWPKERPAACTNSSVSDGFVAAALPSPLSLPTSPCCCCCSSQCQTWMSRGLQQALVSVWILFSPFRHVDWMWKLIAIIIM